MNLEAVIEESQMVDSLAVEFSRAALKAHASSVHKKILGVLHSKVPELIAPTLFEENPSELEGKIKSHLATLPAPTISSMAMEIAVIGAIS